MTEPTIGATGSESPAPPAAPTPSGRTPFDDLAVAQVAVQQPVTPAPRQGGPLEWFTRSHALAETRAALLTLSPARADHMRQAVITTTLADRALDPVDPPRAGSTVLCALSLYRPAAYWALLAQSDAAPAKNLAFAFDGADPAVLAAAGGDAHALDVLRDTLVTRTFVDDAQELPEEQRARAMRVATFVHALLERANGPHRRAAQLELQRFVRSVTTVVLTLGLVFAVVVGVRAARRPPDLARGKPWKASSQPYVCHPEIHDCSGVRTDILFHTNEEESPWMEIDLGAPTAFTTVEVSNRTDCCPDRAVPLVVEVSTDHVKWAEVARRTEPFGIWTAKFAAQHARWVRVRVTRKSILHLEQVSVR